MIHVNKLTLNSPLLPEAFCHIPDPPKQLFFRGKLDDFSQSPRLAVVGSRKVTPYGRAVTQKLVQALVGRGIIIVSGLALGVDSIAHEAALQAGGRTVAVLACGVERIYPAAHTQLGERILDRDGAIISEYPTGTEPLPHQFIARNRIIAGLSDAVLITEAAEKSGSLHTANFALDQGRIVLSVPGNITNSLSVGTNNLIKAGAIPVTNVDDIVAALGLKSTISSHVIAANAEESAIISLLEQGISDGAKLQNMCNLSPAIFNQTLTMLEISGKIRPLGGGNWALS